jgi:hypothetical protein
MKLRRDFIEFISQRLAERLIQKGYIQPVAEAKAIQARISQTILEDLKVEDDLDEEVRKILEGYTHQMRQQHIEYYEMFQKVKRELAKKRNIIL